MGGLKIAVVGAGRMGTGLARLWRDAGHEVRVCFSRDPVRLEARALELGATAAPTLDAVTAADVVLLAAPWHSLPQAFEQLGPLTGKVVIDCVNPIADGDLALGCTTSAAEEIQRHVPSARVVKAFNVLPARALDDPAGASYLVFYCGDDADALQTVKGLVEDAGFKPVDCGPLKSARYLEPFAMLCIGLGHSPTTRPGTAHFFEEPAHAGLLEAGAPSGWLSQSA